MGIRDTMLMAAEPYLTGGEQVQAVFGAQTARPGVLIVSNGLPPVGAAAAAGAMGTGSGLAEHMIIGAVVGGLAGMIVGVIMQRAGGNRHLLFVVTSSRILVLQATPAYKRVIAMVTALPRSTRLGPPSGLWYTFPLDDAKVRVHWRQFKEIREADRLLPTTVTAN